MTWEETIIFARSQDQFQQLIQDAYLDENLQKNYLRFRASIEFKETLNLIRKNLPKNSKGKELRLLDLGAGNGISSVAFAKENFKVIAVEPDASDSLGIAAIQQLKTQYNLSNLDIQTAFGESLPFQNECFDVVYARQAMHHANDLYQFIREAARVLKKGGVLITVRDHVVNDEVQKKEFLESHPFQKYYQGENAFSIFEYTNAFKKAGLLLNQTLGPLDTAINYSPRTKQELIQEFREILQAKFKIKFFHAKLMDELIFNVFKWRTNNLNAVAGRLFSFVATKP